MPRRKSAKFNELKEKDKKLYAVFLEDKENPLCLIKADGVHRDADELVFIEGEDEEEIAVFKNWLYYEKISLERAKVVAEVMKTMGYKQKTPPSYPEGEKD